MNLILTTDSYWIKVSTGLRNGLFATIWSMEIIAVKWWIAWPIFAEELHSKMVNSKDLAAFVRKLYKNKQLFEGIILI